MLESISDCPRNFTTIQCGENPVNHRFPQNFQMISTWGISGAGRESCYNLKAGSSPGFQPDSE
jgi:hypothetical protein